MEKHKVGILTMYYNNFNFGGQLQAFALQYAIERIGFDAEQICFDFKKSKSCSLNDEKKLTLNKCKKILRFKFVIKKILKIKVKIDKRKITRVNNFIKFQNSILHSEDVYDIGNISKSLNIYDNFVCGSDQIWNDWGLGKDVLRVYTLDFVPSNINKFSYAASSGSRNALIENKAVLSDGIKKLNSISVRESHLKEIVEEISGENVTVVLDPVFLLSSEEWNKVTSYAMRKTEKKYAVCYFLGTSRKNRKMAEKLAHQMGLRTVFFPYIEKECVEDAFCGDIRDYDSGPAEFVQIIKNADYIFTDSFHATVFAVIFKKDFYVFQRETRISGSQINDRLYDFLEQVGLLDRLLKNEIRNCNRITETDYLKTENIIKKRKEISLSYLKEALSQE